MLTKQKVTRERNSNKHRFYYGYIIVVASFSVLVLHGGTFYTYGIFFKPILNDFGWTRAMTSGAFSLNVFLVGLFGIIVGRLIDRFGPRIIVTVSGVLWGLGYFLMSQISTIWHIYMFYGVLISVGMASVYVPSMSLTARWFVKKRGLMTGIVLAGLSFGGLIMPPIVSLLITAYGWRDSFIIMGIITLLLVVLAAQFLRREPSEVRFYSYDVNVSGTGSVKLASTNYSLREALRTRQFWILFAILFASYFSIDSIIVHIVPYITDLHISANISAGFLAIISGLNFVGKFAVGSTSDRIGNKQALVISLFLMAFALFLLLISRQIWMLYLVAVVFGLGFGGIVTLQSPLVAWLFGLKSHGVILGLLVFSGTIGGVFGPIIAGYIFDVMASYNTAFLLCTLVSAIGLISALFLKSTRTNVD